MLSRIHTSYPDARLDGVLVQPMVTGGQELILGGRQDPNFGPVVLIGLGGIFVEVLEEVSLRVAPITHQEAMEMIDELRGAPILKGARGHKPADLQAVSEALLRLSQLLIDFPEIRELDINPLRVFQDKDGCRALDARVMLQS
jgi:acyl-CoA synthetase (NDP forming)